MAKFKVKDGTHMEGGKTYSKGDVVVSVHDLVKLFPEKFERVTAAPADAAPAIRDHRNFDDPEASAVPAPGAVAAADTDDGDDDEGPKTISRAAKSTKGKKKPFNFDE